MWLLKRPFIGIHDILKDMSYPNGQPVDHLSADLGSTLDLIWSRRRLRRPRPWDDTACGDQRQWQTSIKQCRKTSTLTLLNGLSWRTPFAMILGATCRKRKGVVDGKKRFTMTLTMKWQLTGISLVSSCDRTCDQAFVTIALVEDDNVTVSFDTRTGQCCPRLSAQTTHVDRARKFAKIH